MAVGLPMGRPITLAIALSIWLAGPEPAQASDDLSRAAGLPAATVYATATVEERAVDEATASVTVIGADEITARGAMQAVDLLPFVSGVSLVSGGTRGGLTVAQIRGGDPNFTRVLIDGVAVNDGTYQVGGVFDFEALPADAVERIEVVRGPLSSFYGSVGLAGAIQLVTRTGEGPVSGSLRLTGGDADLRRVASGLGGGGVRADGFLSLVVEEESERIADESIELAHLQSRARFRLGASTDLSLAVRVARWDADDYPDASGGPLFGSGELRSSEHDETSLSLRWTATRRAAYHVGAGSLYRHDLDRQSPAVFPLVPESMEETTFTRGRVGWASSVERGDGQWTFGADVEWEDGDNTSVLLLPPFLGGDVAGDYSLRRTTPGALAEWLLRRDRWTLELGVRVDAPEDLASGDREEEVSPRLGLAWRLDDDTRLRASVGRAFKLPSYFALASPRALGGNPSLEPETMLGGDVGIEHSMSPDFDVSLTYLWHRYEDLVDFDFQTFLHVNRSVVDAEGVELFLDWTPNADWRVAVNGTWQDVENRDTGLPLRNRPKWAGGLRIDWTASDRVRLGLDVRSVSNRRDEQIPVPQRDTVSGYELVGLAAAASLGADWRVSARVDNLTDEEYETLIGFPGAGRSARVSLAWSFGG